MKTTLKNIFTLDLRALALMRILTGGLIILDLFIRGTDLKAHYSDEGLLPLNLLFQHSWDPWNISIHTISGLWQVQAVLFLIAGLFAFSLMIGYKTKVSAFVSWFLLMSLQNRNPLILQGGDDLLRMLLFWGIFLPWEKFYSFDQVASGRVPEEKSWFGIAGIGYLLQIASVYFFSALLKKTSPEWTTEGTAIYYALSLDQMVFPLGKLIYPYFSFLKYLTFFVFYIELLAPLLFFIPVYNTFFKKLALLLLIAFHIGIASTLFVGLFFIIGIVSMTGIFPKPWMDKLDNFAPLFKRVISIMSTKIIFNLKKYIYVRSSIKINNKIMRPVKLAALSIVIAYSLLYNWQTTSFSSLKIDSKFKGPGQLLGINQNWGMFAPNVFKDDGWYVFEARTTNNELIDLNKNGNPIEYSKPESVVSLFKNDRWRKYSENYLFICHSEIRPYYCNFLMNEWNQSHSDRMIDALKIIYMKEVTQPGYLPVQPTKEVLADIENN